MANLWALVTLALIVQDFTSTAAALLAAQRAGLNLWIVHAIWLIATTLEIYIGFAVGKWIQRRYADSKVDRWGKKIAKKAETFLGKWGKSGFVFLLAFLAYAWLAAFIAAWIDVPLGTAIIFSLIGELVWYIFEWATALGVGAISPNLPVALAIVVVVGVAITIGMNAVNKKAGMTNTD